jgi:hypothetical protein
MRVVVFSLCPILFGHNSYQGELLNFYFKCGQKEDGSS